ncbi:autotransporter outer membrane beta-barrel domain-containing protein, partial [Ralstonia pseudosolanacearum]
GSTINLTGGTATTTGTSGYGLLSYGAAARLNANNVVVTTQGNSAPGATAWGTATNDDVRLSLAGGSVTTQGQSSHGLYVYNNLAQMTLDGTSVTTNGQAAFGARISNGTLNATNSNIVANGASAFGIGITSNPGVTATINLTGGSVRSAQSDAIAVNGGSANISLNGTTVTGNPNWLRTIGATVRAADPLAPPDSVTSVTYDGVADAAGAGVTITPGLQAAPIAGQTSVATVVATHATLTGSATTDADTTSTVTLNQNTLWNMT